MDKLWSFSCICLAFWLNFVPSTFLLQCKKQIDVSFSCICPVIDNEFRHNIVKVVCGSSYFDNVMTKFMINNRTDAWKTDVNLLIKQRLMLVIVSLCGLLFWVCELNQSHCVSWELLATLTQITCTRQYMTKQWFDTAYWLSERLVRLQTVVPHCEEVKHQKG